MSEARSGTLVLYGLTFAGYFVAGLVSAALLRTSAMLHPLPLGVIPFLAIPLAGPALAYAVRGRGPLLGLGLTASAALGAVLFALVAMAYLAMAYGGAGVLRALRQGAAETMLVAAMAGAGTLVGVLLVRRWRYDRAYAVTGGLLVAATAMYAVANGPEWEASGSRVLDTTVEMTARHIENLDPRVNDERYREQLNFWKWFRDHHRHISAGILGATLLVEAALLVSLGGTWARRFGGVEGLQGVFVHLRPPEWVVWIAIALAVLGYVDWQWPTPWLRTIVWNSGLVLSAVYFMTGLAVAGFAGRLFRPGPFLMAAVLVLVFLAGLYPVLAMLGLFDTWADFRERMVRAVEQARRRSEDDGED